MRLTICGTGPFGRNLGAALRGAGYDTISGTRSPRGHEPREPGLVITDFATAIGAGDVIVVAVPGTAAPAMLDTGRIALSGKVIVDATNLLDAQWLPIRLEGGQANAERLQSMFPNARVVKAFNTIFADTIVREVLEAKPVRPATFLAGDDADALRVVADLASAIGIDPIFAGGLASARHLEAMAHLHIQIATVGGRGTTGSFAYV